MRMMLVSGFFLMPASVAAQTVPECMDVVSQMDMNACVRAERDIHDAGMNAAYARAMAFTQDFDAQASPAGAVEADNLRAAQLAWLAYRDAACHSEGIAARGTEAEPEVISGCMARLTASRAGELEYLVGRSFR